MSEEFAEEKPKKVLRFLNDYRKKLSLLKIKSFYANHLCKRNCFANSLLGNNDTCVQECDQWLDGYFELKSKKNPDPDEMVLFSSTEVPPAQRTEYEKGVAQMRLAVSSYVHEL